MLAIGINLLEDYTKELESRLLELEKQEVFIGVTPEQGTHEPSGLNYTDLLWIHDNGIPDKNIPPRPVAEWSLLTFEDDSSLAKPLKTYLSDLSKKPNISLENVVKPFAYSMWQTGYDVFGNLNYLESNAESTIKKKGKNSPLIDTGELRDEWGVYINNVKVK